MIEVIVILWGLIVEGLFALAGILEVLTTSGYTCSSFASLGYPERPFELNLAGLGAPERPFERNLAGLGAPEHRIPLNFDGFARKGHDLEIEQQYSTFFMFFSHPERRFRRTLPASGHRKGTFS